MQHQMTWQTSKGQTVVVVANGQGTYQVTLDGMALGTAYNISALPRALDAARKQGVVAVLMINGTMIALTSERKAALEALNTQATAAYTPSAREQLLMTEATLLDAQERLTRDGYGATGANGRAVEQAQTALHTLAIKHADEWAAMQTDRAAEAERKAAELRDSFAARGLD